VAILCEKSIVISLAILDIKSSEILVAVLFAIISRVVQRYKTEFSSHY